MSSRDYNYYGHSRVMCDVLEEMRKCNKVRNYAPLGSLIEEAQHMANRMEAGLSDKHDLEEMDRLIKDRREKLIALDKELGKKGGKEETGGQYDE